MSKMIDMLAILTDEKNKWLEKNSDDEIRKFVVQYLDNAKTNTLLSVLGFEMGTHYHNNAKYLRVDHCNNRSGNSIIGDLIKETAKKHLSDLCNFASLSAPEMDMLKKEMHDAYLTYYRSILKEEARSTAIKHARELIKKEIENSLSGDAEKMRLILMEANK